VVYSQGANRIAADRADFNTSTRLGTFYNATGIATAQPQRQRSSGPIVPLPVAGQDTDVYFYGETVEKIGPKKYRITNGGFTTCVQPTPRWELASGTIVLNIDHYTFLRQSIFKVKGVPMLYLPVLYYPTKREARTTGFLIPTYGSSTVRGQTLHNAFFWAINRSQDATFLHDWFSKVGQGAGSEYRYNLGTGDGSLQAYLLDQRESTYTLSGGTTSVLPASRSYEIRGSLNQVLPGRMRARGRIDYFSNVATMQTFNTNVYDASRRQRTFGGNVTGAWRGYALNGTLDHSEYFYGTTSSMLSGSMPRVTFSRSERPLLGSPIYVSVGTEFARLLRDSRDLSQVPTREVDTGLTRLDVVPQIRYPFKKWQWFTVNSTFSWRDTYYTRSVDPTSGKVVDAGVNRRFFQVQSQIVGPVFARVWDTPNNRYAEKFKHSIEPSLMIDRTSSIDNFNRILQLEGVDAVIGSATRLTYGVSNRFFAKRREGPIHQAREIVSVGLAQSYYTDARSAQYDRQYATSFTGAPPNHFSPVALSVSVMPSPEVNITTRAEFDSRYHALRTISANGTYAWTGRLQTSVGWTKQGFIKELPGFNDPKSLAQGLNVSANAHTKDNRFGGMYGFNYDVLRKSLLQQQLTGFYSAQCCGVALQYQVYNFSGTSLAGVIPSDHRFFLSFTLAGLGNFSPFNGALSGVPR
jgi:LPS-assembly protein